MERGSASCQTDEATKYHSESELSEDELKLEDIWRYTFHVGIEWNMLNAICQYNWDFSNLENAFEEEGKLCGQNVYLFGNTEAQVIPYKGKDHVVSIPVVFAVVSPFPPSDKIGITAPYMDTEEIVTMEQMKLDWVQCIPLKKRGSEVERVKNTAIHILSSTNGRSAFTQLTKDQIMKYKFCIPYIFHPFKENEFYQSTEVHISFPSEPKPIFCEFDWEMDELENFVKEKVREAKKASKEARVDRKKAFEEKSEATRSTFLQMKFYKFYPEQTPDTPDVSSVKVPSINRYYGMAHEIL